MESKSSNILYTHFQDPVLPDETVIVIRSLVPGGAAEYDGRLHPGHRLMSVNDTNLEHATLDIAVQTLKSTERGMMIFLYSRVVSLFATACSQRLT
jgi:C-terminal processing protease CtpA/Prc